MNIKQRIENLSKELLRHQHLYYIKAEPEISDKEYDRLFDELVALEKKYPEYAFKNSPTKRVGSDLSNVFAEKKHEIPVLSLDKEYTLQGLTKWVKKIISNSERELSFVVEEKIDGASIVLYYKNGMLDSALTRGNGMFGNDVTENIRTIKKIPLITEEKSDFAVRGEIFINKSDFLKYNKSFENKYSNPRNLAAGSLRNLKSSVVAKIPLNFLAYEGFFKNQFYNNHILILLKLKHMGFCINKNTAFFSSNIKNISVVANEFPEIIKGKIKDISDYIEGQIKSRNKLNYEIDGLVVKINEIDVRENLGHTSHHPRWEIAFKFDSPIAQTVLINIVIQVGRNGRVTPVAILEPVKIAGSVVSRATLHNQEYIEILELGPGDLVSISKRGDIIPAVEEVIEKSYENPVVYKFQENCPFCGSRLIKQGAHHFCKNRECQERKKRSLIYFASKDQMDIDTLGEKTIKFLFERGFVKIIPDIYKFNYDLLLKEEGFKERKVDNIKKSIEKSKSKPFKKVLAALGFDGLGTSVASELIKNGFNSIDEIIEIASKGKKEEFSKIGGFGIITAELLIEHFTDNQNLELIRELKKCGLDFKAKIESETLKIKLFENQTWAITGSFENFKPRSKAAKEIEQMGGMVNNTISSKTTHILIGSSPGSKLEKARSSNIKIVNEKEFLDMLNLSL
jgi:DNA ligase (NAD+)